MSPLKADQRDCTPEPPALLDPWWVLTMRRRLRDFQVTGKMEDWYPASRGPEDRPGRAQ